MDIQYFNEIQQVVCMGEKVPPPYSILQNKTRKREIVFSRQLVMYFLHELTGASWANIGNQYGKDHATAMHAHKHILDLMDTEKEVAIKVAVYQAKIEMVIDFEKNVKEDRLEEIKAIIKACVESGSLINYETVIIYNKLLEIKMKNDS